MYIYIQILHNKSQHKEHIEIIYLSQNYILNVYIYICWCVCV